MGDPVNSGVLFFLRHMVPMEFFLKNERSWADLCNALRCRTDDTRDALHRVLHEIATPHVTPESGPGRRGTLWKLNEN